MAFTLLVLSVFVSSSNSVEIELLQCKSPDLPVWGSYGPKLSFYWPGDVIHYFCNVANFLGGNFIRKCLDTGEWTGDTPVCDPPSAFRGIYQSSTYESPDGGGGTAQAAVDGRRDTCTETIGGEREEWWGNFTQGGELIRVMLFLPTGPVNIEVVIMKADGDEAICNRVVKHIDRFDWITLNCPGPNNVGATGLKIRSLTDDPLKICEVQAYVLSSPRCLDPHYRVENGLLRITRRTATLVCDAGFKKSPETKLQCVRDRKWNRKNLYCLDPVFDTDEEESFDDDEKSERNRERERESA